jgi:hypothetical protein
VLFNVGCAAEVVAGFPNELKKPVFVGWVVPAAGCWVVDWPNKPPPDVPV